MTKSRDLSELGGGFLRDQTGAVTRRVEDKLADSVSAIDFGADPTGTDDSTAAIQAALDANSTVYVPNGTYRIDDCIIIPAFKTLLVNGTLKRIAAHSSSTRPVVRLKGSYTALMGFGPGPSVIDTENASPNGVVLWGAEDPTTEYGAYRWVTVSDLRIRSQSVQNTTNKTLALQNSQFWIGGALYDGVFQNLHLFNGYHQIYLNPISNGNVFNNIFSWRCNGYMLNLDGVSGGLVTDNMFCNFMQDGGGGQIAGYRGRFVNNCSFANCGGEPGSGVLWDFDNTCSSIAFHGWSNYSSLGTFAASNSSYMVQGFLRARIGTFERVDIRGDWMEIDSNTNLYGRFRFTPSTTTPFPILSNQFGSLNISPGTAPGSGTANVTHWLKGAGIGGAGGTTYHNLGVDGGGYFLNGVYPQGDDNTNVGSASLRFSEIFATNGTINTSDSKEKQQVRHLEEAEVRVAKSLKSLIRAFKRNSAVQKKGDSARIHFGVIAQDVENAFKKEGLEADDYGMFCRDAWYELDGKTVEADESGKYPEGSKKRERLGIRYDELLAFIISSL